MICFTIHVFNNLNYGEFMTLTGVYQKTIIPDTTLFTLGHDGSKHTRNTDIYSHVDLPLTSRFVDGRSFLTTVADSILAYCRNIEFILEGIGNKILLAANLHPFSEYCLPSEPKTWNMWKEGSTGLHLFSHGFMGSPTIWNVYIKALRAQDSSADVRAPAVPHKGNCGLEEATKPIREMVKAYINDQADKKENTTIPINLYGVSNGARITLNLLQGLIDPELQGKLADKNIKIAFKVNCIAGVLRGTRNWALSLAACCRLSNWIAQKIFKISPEILSDFVYNSTASAQLIDKTRTLENSNTTSYEFSFYASTEDNKVNPYTSSLPILRKNENHYIVHGEGHESIVKRVLPLIIKE